MKKLLGIVVLSFFLNTNLFANTWDIKEQKDEFKGTSFKYVISNLLIKLSMFFLYKNRFS